MKVSAELFHLIKSLSPHEKRYFKLFAKRHTIGKKNNYEELFDFMDKHDGEYNEAILKEKLKKKPWIQNFAIEKKQLEELVLKAMRGYHESTYLGKLESDIGNIRFLLEKGLVDNALKRLEKAFDEAKVQEDLVALISLYQLKLGMIKLIATQDEREAAEKDFEDEALAIKMLDAERRISHIRRMVYNINVKGAMVLEKESVVQLEGELANIETEMPMTLKGRFRLLNAKAMIYDCQNRYELALGVYENMLDIWDDNVDRIGESKPKIFGILSNYLVCAHRLERYEAFPQIIKRMEALDMENEVDGLKVSFAVASYKLLYALNTNSIDYQPQLVKDILASTENDKLLISPKNKANAKINACIYLLMHQQYQQLADILERVAESWGVNESYLDNLAAFKYLELIAVISLERVEEFESKLRNWVRWLKINNLYNQYTKVLVQCLKEELLPKSERKGCPEILLLQFPAELQVLKEIYLIWKRKNLN